MPGIFLDNGSARGHACFHDGSLLVHRDTHIHSLVQPKSLEAASPDKLGCSGTDHHLKKLGGRTPLGRPCIQTGRPLTAGKITWPGL